MHANLCGHTKNRTRLARLYQQKHIPHALLFSGPRGAGKKLVAIELYQTLVCEEEGTYGGCGNCKSCQLVQSGSQPNFTIINCEDKEACSVERIRTMLYELHLRVSAGEYKILILDNVEHLSEQAQNILLKALEEPRKDTYFCLITASLSRLLKTVQSRSQVWYFDSLSDAEVARILEASYATSPELQDVDLEAVARLADGSMENIARLFDKNDQWKQAEKLLECLSAGDLNSVFAIIQQEKAKKEELRPVIAALRILSRELMLQASSPDKKFAWSVFLNNCLEAERLIFDRNLSAELVLNNLALSFVTPSTTLPFTSIGNDATVLTRYTV